jgi:hypothetical protein
MLVGSVFIASVESPTDSNNLFSIGLGARTPKVPDRKYRGFRVCRLHTLKRIFIDTSTSCQRLMQFRKQKILVYNTFLPWT